MRPLLFLCWAGILALLLFGAPCRAAPCAPAEVAGATGSPIRVGSKLGGVWAYTFCVDDYEVTPLYLYAPWEDITPSVLADIQVARASVTAFREHVARVTGRQCDIAMEDSTVTLTIDAAAVDTHDELCTALRDDMAARWPPTPVWRVVPSTSGSRPMYPVVAGVRASTAVPTPRAANNAACSCTAATAIAAGRYRYCPVPPHAPNLVAYCGRAL